MLKKFLPYFNTKFSKCLKMLDGLLKVGIEQLNNQEILGLLYKISSHKDRCELKSDLENIICKLLNNNQLFSNLLILNCSRRYKMRI